MNENQEFKSKKFNLISFFIGKNKDTKIKYTNETIKNDNELIDKMPNNSLTILPIDIEKDIDKLIGDNIKDDEEIKDLSEIIEENIKNTGKIYIEDIVLTNTVWRLGEIDLENIPEISEKMILEEIEEDNDDE